MCGRFALEVLMNELVKRYEIEEVSMQKWRPSYNIAPTQQIPIVNAVADSKSNELSFSTWGLIPHYAKSQAKPMQLINARAETVDSSPAFRYAFENNRCLIPFTHFFEWKKEKTKIPYAIGLKTKEIGSFAGIYSEFDGKKYSAIITTTPNDLMKPIHDRMPVILDKKNEKKWLFENTPKEKLKALLVSFPENKLEAHAVSTLVNSPRNNSPEVLLPPRVSQQKLF